MSSQSNEILAGKAIATGAYDEAVRLLQPLAERNSEYALLTLGWIYATGATGKTDKRAARSYYEGALGQGSAAAHLYLGWLLLEDGQDIEAREAFERGAQLNDEECKSVLARLADNANEKLAAAALKEGRYQDALRLLRPLAERNSQYALLCLGWLYEGGEIGTPDFDAACSHYKRAATLGSTAGCFELGRLLSRRGEEAQARTAFEAGSERGDVPSMARLGKMMVDGVGGAVDVKAGVAWLERAAQHGHAFAQRSLLAIEEANAQTLLARVLVRFRIAKSAFKSALVLATDPKSDRAKWLRSSVGLPNP